MPSHPVRRVAAASVLVLSSLPAMAWQAPAAEADQLRTSYLASRPASTAPSSSKPGKNRRRPKAPATNLGVGYSVFEQRADGATVRTDPRQIFESGDRIRLLIEPGGTGFLYIFHVEGDAGTPSMLFPSARLSGGENAVFAHEPVEVPSRAEPEPLNQWFVFDNRPGTEHLFFIVSRTPLAGVPTGKALRAWASRNGGAAAPPWRPSPADWKRIVGKKAAAPIESLDALFGTTESEFERDAVMRGLGLPAAAPPPTIISMSGEKAAKTFVTRVALTHR